MANAVWDQGVWDQDTWVARCLQVYPKVVIEGSMWTFMVKVDDQDTGIGSRFEHTIPAGVTAALTGLKLVYDLIVGPDVTDQDVDDALYLDDIGSGATCWTNAQARTETNIGGQPPDYTQEDFWASISKTDTGLTRSDIEKAFVTQRGWTITSFHQHEGDGTNTDE